jgi:allophanate hydrolase subunit 2
MAYRLQGEVITYNAGADIISQGMALGAVQVPADGQPIVMLADHPTTGGYTQVAMVSRADLPLVAQCEPGVGRVKFKQVSLEEAQQAYLEEAQKIESGINDDVEDWMLL